MIRVCLYSDQYTGDSVMAQGLRAALIPAGNFDFRPLPLDREGMLAALRDDLPHVILLDAGSDVFSSLLRDIRDMAPAANPVLWVESISVETAYQAIRLGARGILRKSLPIPLVVRCLQKVHQGELWFEKSLTDRLTSAKRVVLSPREGQLIALLSHGLRNKEIAAALRITEGTVKVYLSRLFQKAGVQDRFELAMFGVRNGSESPIGDKIVSGQPVPRMRSLLLDRGPAGKP